VLDYDSTPGLVVQSALHSGENAVMSAAPQTLKGKVVGGISWNVVTQVVTQVSRIALGVVLARLLTPREFGLAGMALVFTNLLALFTDLSLGAALIQRPEVTEEDRSTVFWVTVLIGVAFSAGGVAASGLVAGFYGRSAVGPLFAVLSLGFILNALSATQVALATRDFAYRRLQIREMSSVVMGTVAGIIAAVAGLGAWAIVVQSIAVAATSAVLIWTLSPWRPRFIFSMQSLRNLGGFGSKLFASRLLAYANLNGDNLLVGRFLGSRALGVYSLAYNVMFTPMVRIGLPLQQVVFPAYSRLQNEPERLRAVWLRSKRLSAAVLAPAFLAFLVVAPDLVPVVFGQKWHQAIAVLQLLCVAGVAHSLVTLNWSVLQARGQAGVLFRLNVLNTVVIVGAFALGLHWGVAGVAGCYAAARWLLLLPDMWVTGRSVHMGPIAALRSSGVAVPLAAAAAALAFGLRAALVAEGLPAALRLVVVLAVGGLAYVGLVALAAPDIVREVKGLRSSLARGGGAGPTAGGTA
jgi:O-antigen/teichoic acid export membrane protein